VFLPIRYADDFVVLVTGTEEQARAEKEELAVFLREEMKLTLSPEKTHVTSLTEGFVFLGHRVRLRWDGVGLLASHRNPHGAGQGPFPFPGVPTTRKGDKNGLTMR
jgi:hypothetical protein